MKCAWMLNCAVLFSCAVAAAGDYAVVVSAKTRDDAGWAQVVEALAEKYPSSVVLTWNRNLDELLPTLQERHPRYTCFTKILDLGQGKFRADDGLLE